MIDPEPAPVDREAGLTVIEPSPVPKLTRQLVLGHLLERLVRDGVVRDYTQLARLACLTKARITQLVNLTLLSPGIQNEILSLGTSESRSLELLERDLRRVAALTLWSAQRAAFDFLHR